MSDARTRTTEILENMYIRDLSIKKWFKDSADGTVCGILECTEKPAQKCKICSHWFCEEHLKWHLHPGEDDITEDAEVEKPTGF